MSAAVTQLQFQYYKKLFYGKLSSSLGFVSLLAVHSFIPTYGKANVT